MSVYVTVAAVRIQEWLVRTPKLTLLRGASAALTKETGAAEVEQHLAALAMPNVERCKHAGDVAGVVVVTVASIDAAPHVAARLAARLAVTLPAIEWQAWWTESESYVEAFRRAVILDEQSGVGRSWHPPALLDTPVAESCPGCRREISKDPTVKDGPRLGPDCRVRDAQKGQPRRAWVNLPGAPAHDFDQLARKGGTTADGRRGTIGRRDSANHLATIAADGNRVGAFFEAVATHGSDQLRKGAVRALSGATEDAVRRAIKALAHQPKIMAAIPHLIGGDDILISLPAPLAWPFVAALSAEFRKSLDDQFKDLWPNTPNESVMHKFFSEMSLGIGMVFAHSSHPFADTQDLAHTAMRQAKQSAGGTWSAVTWLDLTAENSIPAGRSLACEQVLADLRSERQPGVLALAPSARAVLVGMLRDLWADSAAVDDVAEAVQSVRRWARRTNTTGLPTGLNAQDPPGDLTTLRELRDLLSRARWWPIPTASAAESRNAS